MKRIISIILTLCLLMVLIGCSTETPPAAPEPDVQGEPETPTEPEDEEEPALEETILLAAAASLKNCIDGELIPMFAEKYPNITVDATYDSSGKLQTQIEEGADVDVFMSAAMKQMNALDEQGLIKEGTIVELLENKIVLILPNDSQAEIASFEDILKAETIAVGDPESVPAGQYAKESFENLGMWEDVLAKSSLGTNVTEVLSWVAAGSADAGVVYATDAAANENVKVVAEAPEGSVSKVIYPIGIINATTKLEAAENFVEFLQSAEALSIFEKYGFSSN
ncbi:MAG: molybdate ABC transporter substrate-binding protein [Clostridiaceae bacterium]|nr:molybdate ABC transporter substrate-binding protein [Clostridiaceae bacterium]